MILNMGAFICQLINLDHQRSNVLQKQIFKRSRGTKTYNSIVFLGRYESLSAFTNPISKWVENEYFDHHQNARVNVQLIKGM